MTFDKLAILKDPALICFEISLLTAFVNLLLSLDFSSITKPVRD